MGQAGVFEEGVEAFGGGGVAASVFGEGGEGGLEVGEVGVGGGYRDAKRMGRSRAKVT